MSNFYKVLLSLALLILAPAAIVFGQPSNIVSGVKNSTAKEKNDIYIKVDFLRSNVVQDIALKYKSFSSSEYSEMDMTLSSSSASGRIPGEDVQAPMVEYFLFMKLADGSEAYYPEDALAGNTIKITVEQPSPKDAEILMLSPDPAEPLTKGDALITISLLKASDDVDKSKTKLLLNGKDVTSLALFADDLIIFSADNFPEYINYGFANNITIELYDTKGTLYHSYSTAFQAKATAGFAAIPDTPLEYYINTRGESRNENIRSNNRWYNNLNLDAKLNYGEWSLDGLLYVTSEEKGYLQPNNRYRVGIKHDMIEVYGGDYTPEFQSLVLTGKRIRGISGAAHMGIFNIKATYGEATRGINGSVIEYLSRDTLGTDITRLKDGRLARVNYGTYERQILAVSPYLQSGEDFKFGLTYMHSKDNMESIEIGKAPQENIVVGTNLQLGFDDQKVMITGQAAFSLINRDISTGTFSDSTIDKVFGPNGTFNSGDAQLIKDIKSILGNFITVNQFLNPLNPQELSSLAYEGALSLNYFGNFLKGGYIYRGSEYSSFGNSFVRTDIAGIQLQDRVRLWDNKLFISLGYENLKDNLQKTKLSTTTYQTISASVSVFPRYDLPSFVVTFVRNDNNNGILATAAQNIAVNGVDDITNKISASVSQRFNLEIPMQASINFSWSKREDKSIRKVDVDNTSLSLTTNQYWGDDLNSYLNANLNNTKIQLLEYNYISLSAGARYNLMDSKLTLAGSINPNFGDLERYDFDASAIYKVMQNLSLQLQMRYIVNKDIADDSIISFVTRFDLR